jgi:hypothetical protein
MIGGNFGGSYCVYAPASSILINSKHSKSLKVLGEG